MANSNKTTGWMGGIGGMMGAIPGLNVLTPGLTQALGGIQEGELRDQMIANAEGINLPKFTGQYDTVQYAGDFDPTAYQTPEAAMYQQIQDSPEARQQMVQALQRMQGFADQSAGSQESLGRFQALDEANQLSKSREGAIAAQMQRRGQGGSMADAMLRQQAAQAAANQAQSGTLNAAAQAALQRFQGTQGVMQGASALRGQDNSLAAQNAAIINQFNMANTNARNATNAANTDMRNQAGLRNLNTVQGLNQTNTGIRNSGINRNDSNAMNAFNAGSQRVGQINQAIGGQAQAFGDLGAKSNAAGKQGYDNLKDLLSGGAGGMGGGMGG